MRKIKTFVTKFKIPEPLLKKILIPIYLVLILISVYHVVFAQRIILGVYVGNINVGGKTFEEANSLLRKSFGELPKEINVTYNGESFPISKEEISLYYDFEQSVKRAFEVGRTKNIITDSKDKLVGFFRPLKLDAKYSYDELLLSNKLAMIKAEIYVEPKKTDFRIENNHLEVVPSQTGLIVDEKKLYDNVVVSFASMDFTSKEIPVKIENPTVKEQDILAIINSLEKVVLNNLKIKYTSEKPVKVSKEWVLDSTQLIDFITFKRENAESDVEAKLYAPKFEAFLDTISQEVNQLPRGKVTEADGSKVVKFEITQPGLEIDAKKFTENFKTALFSGQKEVALDIKEISQDTNKDTYGIYSLLGEGKSTFKGSIKARINNLTLAASRTDGVLVPPGAIYSLNNTIGEISGRTGYDTAYIIQNGRTVLGEGGGVCQTSTTLFRAVLNAGLPVVMRYPHAYRVSYYEQDSPPGIDASIFQPSLDFKFKNDTPNYVLIQNNWDLESSTLVFRLYGTPDGRSVEMTTPTLTNVVGAPASLYVDDPTLAKGVVRQVDWSAPGGTTSFTRLVKRGDEVLYNDTFTTRYQPWRAVFLKGTKE